MISFHINTAIISLETNYTAFSVGHPQTAKHTVLLVVVLPFTDASQRVDGCACHRTLQYFGEFPPTACKLRLFPSSYINRGVFSEAANNIFFSLFLLPPSLSPFLYYVKFEG